MMTKKKKSRRARRILKKKTTTQSLSKTNNPEIFPELIKLTNIELKRLDWSVEQAREYLLKTYDKRSRQVLSDDELIEFLEFLKRLPS